ncbi:hypothetical protein L1987_47824 [Smallanthus sonchifolius]|uniref:Uncharacterized protein n=1 Tax=Smallanthus sonchifolius TaxID=185202 RepID=A0ACB9FQ86_9ASTR|nr:hypothetical protein L1987_47824 [Smallanthus sonchifolius]
MDEDEIRFVAAPVVGGPNIHCGLVVVEMDGFVTIRASKIYRIGLVHRSKQAISSSMVVRVFDFAGFAEYGWCIVVIR